MNPYLAKRAFARRRILVGVCGGVAAYKIADLVGQLVQADAEVRVAMTPEATRFVSPLTFEALSGNPVASDLFGSQRAQADGGEAHIALSDWPEAIILAPATANVIAKLAHGLADEIVSTTVLASKAPLLVAPAMHTRMWEQPATQANVNTLRERGVTVVGPVEGRLASGEIGPGRLADYDAILVAIRDALPGARDMDGLAVLVTAGGTREPLDPVRFIGNHSSGLMGHALAAAADARGATTTLVTASKLPVATGVEAVTVETAAQMAEAVRQRADQVDVLLMAAAVADVRPKHPAEVKMAKAELPDMVELEPADDILGSLAAEAGKRARAVKVGFAAETHDLLAHAHEKLVAKGLELIVANDVSDRSIGMGSPDNEVTIIARDGSQQQLGRAPKEEIADRILDAALAAVKVRDAAGGRPETAAS